MLISRAPRRWLVGWGLGLLLSALPLSSAQAGDPTQRWRTLETPHFYVHYYRSVRHDEQRVALHVARSAEAAHAVLVPALAHEPSSKTHIVLTDDTDGANGSAQIVPMNIIRLYVTGPTSLSTLNDYDDWIYGLVLHEYTHILHVDTIHGLAKLVNYVLGKTWAPNQIQPRWFIEGLAVYYESARTAGGRLRSSIFDMYLRMAVLEGHLLDMDQITSSTRIFPRGNVPYLYGSRFVKYLADRFGEDKLTAISHRYGGMTIPYAINRVAKEILGHSYIDLYKDFREHLRRHYALQRDAAVARGLTAFRPITTQGETTATPVFSRDGREVAFVHSDGHSQLMLKVLDVARGKVTQQFEQFGGSGVDFSPDGEHLVYGGSAVWRTYYSYDDLFVRHRRTGAVRRLTSGLRARDPAVSPDGRQVAFVTNDLGDMNLAIIPFQGGTPRLLYRGQHGDQVYTPRWSPDGRQLVYSRWRDGGERDLYLMELATGRVQRLTSDRALDTDPVFSPDGRRVYFSSDRTGIFNIYCLELQTGDLKQVTNVIGGALSPTVSPDGKEIYYVGFSTEGYDLHALALQPQRFLPALPYVDTRPAAPRVPAPREPYPEGNYNPLYTIYPRNWSFRFGTDAFGNMLGLDLLGSDVVGLHRWSITANFSLSRPEVSYAAGYGYYGFWPSIDLYTSRVVGVRGGVVVDGAKQNYLEQSYGGGLTMGLPILRRPNHAVTLSLGYRLNWFRNADEDQYLRVVEPGMVSPRSPEVGFLAGATMGLSYASLQRYTWSISAQKGRSLGLGLQLNHPSLGSDYQTTTVTYGWNEFIPMPWADDHVLALRLAGGIGAGSVTRRGLFFLGGFPEQDVLRAFFDPANRVAGAFLRGYPPGVVYGDQYHLLNVEYRLPLLDVERGFSSLPLYFTNIHAAAFVDAGNAFFGEPVLSDFKVGVGAELRVEAVIGYYVPSTFRLGYARGLMDRGDNEIHFLLGNVF